MPRGPFTTYEISIDIRELLAKHGVGVSEHAEVIVLVAPEGNCSDSLLTVGDDTIVRVTWVESPTQIKRH